MLLIACWQKGKLKKAKEEDEEYNLGKEEKVEDTEEEDEMVAVVVGKDEAGMCFGLLLQFCF